MFAMKTTVFFALVLKLSIAQNAVNNCNSKVTCSDCIQEVGCRWCITPASESHCLHEAEGHSDWCQPSQVVNPQGSFQILKNELLSSVEGKVVQIKPQKVRVSLRKGEEFKLDFQYAQAENYPVDLYYIMDLSASMEPHKKKLALLGSRLANTMRNITSDFRLGFGSFVDKVDLPFVSTAPKKLLNPCPDTGRQCASPYSFKNHMSLAKDDKRFSDEVLRARVSGNLDFPEGGFDALMQAIVCKDVIGWRAQARHLVVFSTDADFHIAGDGKLAGVVEPNDAQCHMENNLYTHDLKLDYPSISHINLIAKINNINIVFAIVNKQRVIQVYKKLSEVVENSNMGVLDDKSENVIKLVVENYNKIVDSVTMSSSSLSDVEVKISSTCPSPKPGGCTNIHVGEVVNFTATIKLLECKSPQVRTISIKPETLDESLIVEVETLCDCDCEKPSSPSYRPKAKECSESGTLKCGVCECDSDFFGESCECSRGTSQTNNITSCMAGKDNLVCSGLGVCQCGQCFCNKRNNPEERIFGKFCNCDNYSCKRVGGKLCSQHGTCECGGVCNCEAGWTGEACQCPDGGSSCVKPDGRNLECNGQGECKCGKCECFNEKVRFSGKYCDECPTCEGQRCDELKGCVECQVHKAGEFSKEECESNCTLFTSEIVEKIDVEDRQNDNVKTCTVIDENECTFVFQYEYLDDRQLRVKAEKLKVCPGPADVWPWILGVIGAILLGGFLALLIWKVCTTVHDRREYAKFENERANMQWHRNDNPLYKEATSTFANPLYRMSRLMSKNKSS